MNREGAMGKQWTKPPEADLLDGGSPTATGFDPRALRDVFGTYVTGVTIITALGPDDQPCGVTANSFTSVSLDPPLVLWSHGLSAYSFPIFSAAERFVVNILAREQVELSKRFSTPGIDRFAGVAHRPGIGGAPVLEGCVATLECRKVATYPGGDHAVYLGLVEKFERSAGQPLAFNGGRYSTVHAMDI